MGVVAAITAAILGAALWDAACAAAAGAALAAAIRALAGSSPAALAGACLAPVFAVAQLAEHDGHRGVSWLALAAAAWTFAELARTTTAPIVALLPATVAAILEPACVPLLAIAGSRLVTAPGERPRWVAAVPVVGGLVAVVAIVAGLAHGGAFARLGVHWFGTAPHEIPPVRSLALLGESLGPIAAIAALVGLTLVVRGRLESVAITACVVGAVLVDLRAGMTGPMTLGLAALGAGLATARLAGMIRIPSGQAFAGATCGLLLVLPPLWSAIERDPHVSIRQASR